MVRYAPSLAALLATASAVLGAEEEGAAGPIEAIKHEVDCKPCADTTGVCEIKTKVNIFAGQTGYYEFEGCEGVNPTLHLTVGRTYKFDQSDDTNWYHLLGFAYEADGAHVPTDELEPGIPPPGSGSTCADDNSCPAPMYFMGDGYQGKYSNIPDLDLGTIEDEAVVAEPGSDDFGLDVVEPLFFIPLGQWQETGTHVTYLNFDQEFDKDFFYFCHIHAGMSGRVKLLDAEGNMLSADNAPALPYKYDQVGRYDLDCGTYNTTGYRLSGEESGPGDKCPGFFVCANDDAAPKSKYAECVEAMNCHMMQSMTTYAEGTSELFSHQMIPHHQNAVNMAKALLRAHPGALRCGTTGAAEEGAQQPWACDLIPLLYDIINVQNGQIITMRDALGQLEAPEYANCEVEFTGLDTPAVSERVRTRQVAEESAKQPYVHQADCEPCADTEGQCDVVLKVEHMAGELGYFKVDGCDGVNPTLHLTKGRTYKFDQTDKSNWYHLIGFAYFPDGAHEGVDELEPGLLEGMACAEDNTCPAPMYFMDGEYQGKFSNIPDLVPAMGDEDFGLDAVEPLFFHRLGDWQEYGAMETYLNFDQDYDKDIFYFCHLHNKMSGRIKLKNADGTMMSEANEPAIEYSYDEPDGHDLACGTFGLNNFQLPNDQCPAKFVCDPEVTIRSFASCIDSMNCAMLDGMTTNYGGDGKTDEAINDVILFIRQMIPHHQNAVNMAKAIMRTGAVSCGSTGQAEEGAAQSTACMLEPVALGIVVNQNKQIQIMRGILDTLEVTEETSDCDFAEAGADGDKIEADGSGAYADSPMMKMFATLAAAGAAML